MTLAIDSNGVCTVDADGVAHDANSCDDACDPCGDGGLTCQACSGSPIPTVTVTISGQTGARSVLNGTYTAPAVEAEEDFCVWRIEVATPSGSTSPTLLDIVASHSTLPYSVDALIVSSPRFFGDSTHAEFSAGLVLSFSDFCSMTSFTLTTQSGFDGSAVVSK